MAVHCQGVLRLCTPFFLPRALPAAAVGLYLLSADAPGSEKLNMAFVHGGQALAEAAWGLSNPAGRYLVDVELNGKRTGRRILEVSEAEAETLCLTPGWLNDAGVYVREETFTPVRDETRGCLELSRFPDTEATFDFAAQRLVLRLPQKGLMKRPVVTTREYGHSALRMNYSVNGTHDRSGSALTGVSTLKANLGRWVLDSAASFSEDSRSVSMVTASRALEILDADLTVGQGSAGDSITGSLNMRGVTLRSNNHMRANLTGYSPVFSGVATSPSRVTLIQGGRTVYTELVPAGPFDIRDASLLGQGDVEMVITDEGGRETRERFPLTRLSGQLTPGQQEYGLAAGVVDREDGSGTLRGPLASLSYGRGFRGVTARGSVTGHDRYTGGGGELVAGAGDAGSMAMTGSLSRARYTQGGVQQGWRGAVTWARNLGAAARVQLSTSRRSERYTEAGSFDPGYTPGPVGQAAGSLARRAREQKSEQTLQFTMTPGARSSVGLSAWQRDFWFSPATEKGLTARLNVRPGNTGVSLGGTWSDYQGRSNYILSASVSVPFEFSGRRFSSGTSMSSGRGGQYGVSSGISGQVTDRLGVGVSTGTGRGSHTQSALDADWQGDRVRGNVMVSRQGERTWTAGQVNGSLLALPAAGSLVLSSHTQDTVAVAGVPGVKGVRFTGAAGATTDSRGNVVIPLSGYLPGTVSVDAATLPGNIELATTSRTFTPVAQAVVYLPFETLEVNRYLLQVRGQDGEFVKPGLWARSEKGSPLGFVAHNGVLLINYVDKPESLTLGNCVIPTRKLKDTDKLQEVMCEK